MYCQNCGKHTEFHGQSCSVCGLPWGKTQKYAGFWVRFLAYIIDNICSYVIGFIAGFIIGLLLGLAGFGADSAVRSLANILVEFLISWFYYALLESSSCQATFGKKVLGLVVTDTFGNRITFGKATCRYFGKVISALILCIGYIMIGLTQKKQGLHDKMAGTLVVKK
jgi:uncharacterized RDD family membrane protein YckC